MSRTDTADSTDGAPCPGRWTLLTNHGHVLVALHLNPDLRQREIAELVGITEGGVQRILHDLEQAGCLAVERIGRRNHYDIDSLHELSHPLESAGTVGELLRRLAPQPGSATRDRAA